MSVVTGQGRAAPSDGLEPVVEPLVRSTVFEAGSCAELARGFRERSERVYARFGNPTVRAAARALAEREGAEEGLLFASGMAAITTTLLAFVRGGGHVVCQRDVFAQTYAFLAEVAPTLGIATTFVDATRPEELAAALREETALVYVETPSNPLLSVVDLAAVARLARQRSKLLVVDGTFATPCLQRPLSVGASLVVHSATKYLSGHFDLSAGAVLGPRRLIARVYELQRLLGGIADPEAAWLLLRSLSTLDLRVQRQSATAAAIAAFLAAQEGAQRVRYPGLPGTAGAEVAQRQMAAGGGMVSFEVKGGLPAARAMLEGLRVIGIATSLGGARSVAEIPADLDLGAGEPGPKGEAADVPAGLIRLSVGLEEPALLIEDLARGLAARAGAARSLQAAEAALEYGA